MIDEDFDVFRATVPDASEKRCRVIGGVERLPIASASIDLVIGNHALEHFQELEAALKEIARVLKPAGRLYITVPNGNGFCDDVYRWLFEGGGHVNRFLRDDLVRLVESRVGVRLAQWQSLYSSFAYLRGIPDLGNEPRPDLQARLKRIARLPRDVIRTAQWELYVGTRVVDRFLGTNLATYGWALWFDHGAGTAIEKPPWVNVCMRCGTSHPPEPAQQSPWSCLSCGEPNPVWFDWQP